jgi:hypothetical protein
LFSFNIQYTAVLVIVTERWRGGKDVIPGRTEQLEMSSFPKQMNEASDMRLQLTPLAEALAESYRLLEGYAPMWYTFDHHERAESLLQSMKKF